MSGPIKLYRAYDLTISSQIHLPELIELEPDLLNKPQVNIRLAAARQNAVCDSLAIDASLRVAPQALWFHVPQVGQFLVRNGNEICVEPHSRATEDVVRLFLLGSAFGALLLQRGFLVLHGNAIRIGSRCMVCLGPSGIGKSTLAAAFMRRGFDVLADDVVPINAAFCASPGFPRLKLWQDAAEKLQIATDELSRVGFNLDKFNVPTIQRCPTEIGHLPVGWLYVLEASANVDAVHVAPIRGARRILALIGNIYRPNFVTDPSMEASHFKRCAELSDRAHVAIVQRPAGSFLVDEQVENLLADVNQNT